MNKEQFLLTMQNALSGMPRADLERTLQYYREMIEDRCEEGMSEEAAVADVGDPIELAEAIRGKPAVRTTALREQKPPKARRPMSAGKRAALIVCAILLAAAGILLIIGAMNTRKDSQMKEYTFAGAGIRALELECGAADVKLLPAKDGVCRVQCVDSALLKTRVWLEEGTLHVARERSWSLFPISLKEDYLRVYLPDTDYESLWIKASSGGAAIPADFRFRTAIINTSSGGVGFAAEVTDELNIRSSSGGVAVSGASPDDLFISVSSGGVALSGVTSGKVDLRSSSGGMRLDDIRCAELNATCSSGAIRLSDVIADGPMTLECTSGAIRLEDCDAAELHIQCTSGSVSGHLLTPKTWSASSTSGSVRVPQSSSGGGICNVHTTSGSIRFD